MSLENFVAGTLNVQAQLVNGSDFGPLVSSYTPAVSIHLPSCIVLFWMVGRIMNPCSPTPTILLQLVVVVWVGLRPSSVYIHIIGPTSV